jgi:hypothetical protein
MSGEALTLRPEETEADQLPKICVAVQYHDRQVQIIVDPQGDNWDWAVAEYVREAKRMIREQERREARGG